MRIVKYYQRFCSHRQALIECPDEAIEALPAPAVFSLLTWDEDPWTDAKLSSVVLYLRGATGLDLGLWRGLFPEHIPI